MKITNITEQQRNHDRVNVFVDGRYRFSLLLAQVIDLGIKVGNEYSDDEMTEFEAEGLFGRVYQRALEYSLVRPRSEKEMKDYLYRKTRDQVLRHRQTGERYTKPGVPASVSSRVFDELVKKQYVHDEVFARFWVEYRHVRKGVSRRRLAAELAAKGIDRSMIERILDEGVRDDHEELRKVIDKRRTKYPTQEKLIQYLLRQGFRYDDITDALSDEE